MKRRTFLYAASIAGLGFPVSTKAGNRITKLPVSLRETCTLDGNVFSVYTNAKIEPAKVFHITDTHLSLDDERGDAYKQFSKRMAGAYRHNKFWKSEEQLSSQEGFKRTLEEAKKQKADFLALTGDIFSFPSQAAVEWALEELNKTGIPFAYVAGNHDWHYEGMKGSSKQLRDTWTMKHLKPMYQGKNPLFSMYKLNGIRFVCIDNSTYEILPEQLAFYKEQVKSNEPMILLMHIPLFIPGHNIDFGCAHPEWGEKSDQNFEIERREKWRTGGHTKVTFSFYDEVFNSGNLLAILAGHTHRTTLDVKKDIPQLVSAHNATGFYTEVSIKTYVQD
ncbi:metallophosphoesterase [Puteibacter caeruleilacunae]|nr:metallophosphoesterase [Puteibacter caeruleilacunae]